MNFGENIQAWFSTQVGALFMVAIGAVALVYLFQRKFSMFISFAVFAMIVAVFIFAPESVKDLGTSMWKRVFG
ncbi:hypothetical protein [Alkalihalobacillus sp. TS-13]|uniref:hypothetical protein n=1 Tax=Alkalihalobacillus sp. TS-13 TaxID=2842455 RepID=UPI001C87928D|nr:hypothetical protein [Alkalihalobacillus sp. TS-13]